MVKYLHFNNPHIKNASQRLKKKFQSRTVAAVPATPDAVRALAMDFVSTHPIDQILIYKLRVGVTVLHPNDLYAKKTGRDIATSKMDDVPLKVVGVYITPTHIFVKLQKFKGMDLNLRLNKATNFSTITGSMSGDE